MVSEDDSTSSDTSTGDPDELDRIEATSEGPRKQVSWGGVV